jgi:hypothetical protein
VIITTILENTSYCNKAEIVEVLKLWFIL